MNDTHTQWNIMWPKTKTKKQTKKGNPAFCDNMDEPGEHQAK